MARVAIAVCLLVAGCAGAAVVVPSTQRSAATWSAMVYAAQDGPIWVDVHGQGVDAPAETIAATAAQAMTGAVAGYATTFTADPRQARHRNFRTVIVFDPAPAMSDDAACTGRIVSRPMVPGRLSALAAFCNDDRLLSAASGHVAASSPAAPAVAALLRALTREIFQERPRDSDDSDQWDAD